MNRLLRDEDQLRLAMLEDTGSPLDQYAQQPLPLAPQPAAGLSYIDALSAPAPAPEAAGGDAVDPEPADVVDADAPEAYPSAARILAARRARPVVPDFTPAKAAPGTEGEVPENPNKYDRVAEALYAAGTGSKLGEGFFREGAQVEEKAKDRAAQLRLALLKSRAGPTGDPLLDLKRRKLEAEIAKLGAGGGNPAEAEAIRAMLKNDRAFTERAGGGDYATGAKLIDAMSPESLWKAKGAGQKDETLDFNREKNRGLVNFRNRSLDASTAYKQQELDLQRLKLGEDATNKVHELLKHHDDDQTVKSLRDIHAGLQQIDDIAPGMPHGEIKAREIKDPKTGATRIEDPLSAWTRGMAKIPLGLGTWANSLDQNKLNQMYGIIQQKIIRPMAGANLTESEVQQFQKIFGDSVFGKPEMMAAALDLFRQYTGRRMRDQEVGLRGMVGEDVWNTYKSWGAPTSDDPMYADVVQPFQATRSVRDITNQRLHAAMPDTSPINPAQRTGPAEDMAPAEVPPPPAAPGDRRLTPDEEEAIVAARQQGAASKPELEAMAAETAAKKAAKAKLDAEDPVVKRVIGAKGTKYDGQVIELRRSGRKTIEGQ